MRKIAIFTEGPSELIFVRYFLLLIFGWEKITFQCFKLYAKEMIHASFDHLNEQANAQFLIVSVGNDETVLSAIRDREKLLFQKGYEKIIALRDMYSEAYCNKAGWRINDTITMEFIKGSQKTIQMMSNPDRIKMCFAIMEFEAWLLGMYSIFEKIDATLNVNYIKRELGFDLSRIDPQTTFFKPADEMAKIFSLIGLRYKKSEHDIENICSRMDLTHFANIFENNRCDSFKTFHDELLN